MNVNDVVDGLRGLNVLVVGDAMLDRTIFGCLHPNPESDKPKFICKEKLLSYGGAANFAANSAVLGGGVSFFGVVGDDEGGQELFDLAGDSKFGGRLRFEAFRDSDFETVVKQRLIIDSKYDQAMPIGDGNPYYGRFDSDDPINPVEGISDDARRHVLGSLSGNHDYRSIALVDYAKGVYNSGSIGARLIQLSKTHNLKSIVTPKPRNIERLVGADVCAVNVKEAFEIVGKEVSGKFDVDEIYEVCEKVRQRANSKYAIVTCSGDGVVVSDGSRRGHIETVNLMDIRDSAKVGAGDTFASSMFMAYCRGVDIFDAARIGTIGAYARVSNGTELTVTPQDIKRAAEKF